MVTSHLSPQLFCFPVQRDRLYMLALRTDLMEAAGLSPQRMAELASDMMSRLVAGRELMRDLDDFLLPEYHPLIAEMVRSAVAKREVDEARRCFFQGTFGRQRPQTQVAS